MDPKKVLAKVRLKGAEGKRRVTLYLDAELYDRFKKACGGATLSHVMEELIREFTDVAEQAPKKGGK